MENTRLCLCVDDGNDGSGGSGNPVVAQYVLMTANSSFRSLIMKHRRRWRHKRRGSVNCLCCVVSGWWWLLRLSVARWPHYCYGCSSDGSIGARRWQWRWRWCHAQFTAVTSHFKTFFFLCWLACSFSSLPSLFYASSVVICCFIHQMVEIQKKVEFIQYCYIKLMWIGPGRITGGRTWTAGLDGQTAPVLPPPRPSVLLQRQSLYCSVLDDNEWNPSLVTPDYM